MSMASGMFISVVSLLYPICKSFLPQISQILTDIAMDKLSVSICAICGVKNRAHPSGLNSSVLYVIMTLSW